MGLFHYTGLSGLQGILESNSLWATNLYFLNDKNEAKHGFLCFENTINYLDGNVISQPKKLILKNALDTCKSELTKDFNTRGKNVYGISFCMDSDRLSQWRGYGAYQGVCIEFDKEALISGLNTHGMIFNHDVVNYCSENSTVKMNERINSFFRELKIIPEKMNDDFLWFANAFEMINRITPFFKDDGFSEENEYRFVFSPEHEVMKVDFRVNANGLIPYISVSMSENKKLPIKKIIIGPAKDSEFIINGVRMLLMSRGYENVVIETSKVPYRG